MVPGCVAALLLNNSARSNRSPGSSPFPMRPSASPLRTLVASCLRGALPPVDLRAVCLVRAMVADAVVASRRGEQRVLEVACEVAVSNGDAYAHRATIPRFHMPSLARTAEDEARG
jgi:hypothetical protein